MSYFSVLWRPLISVIPLFVIFATLAIFYTLSKIDPRLSIILGVVVILAMMMFFYNSIQSGIYEMYKELVSGYFNEVRHTINASIFKAMYISLTGVLR